MDREEIKEMELHQLALEYVKLYDQRRSMLDAPSAAEFAQQYVKARKDIKEALKKTDKTDKPDKTGNI